MQMSGDKAQHIQAEVNHLRDALAKAPEEGKLSSADIERLTKLARTVEETTGRGARSSSKKAEPG
jgi:hypothetical protein